jgi:hypothetical protein
VIIASSSIKRKLVEGSNNVKLTRMRTTDDVRALYEWADFVVVSLKASPARIRHNRGLDSLGASSDMYRHRRAPGILFGNRDSLCSTVRAHGDACNGGKIV